MASEFERVYREALAKHDGLEPLTHVLAAAHRAEASGSNKIEALELLGNATPGLFAKRVGDAQIEAIVEATLAGGILLEGLYLCYNEITDKGVSAIARLFQDSEHYTCTLRALDLRSNAIGPAGCSTLMSTLASNSNRTLRLLNLNGNPIGAEGGMAVAELLQENSTLSSLDLGNTEIETSALVALMTVLRSNITVSHLNLENPRTFSRMEDTTFHIAKMLRVNTGLVSLNLGKHNMGDFGAQLLTEYLADNSTLLSLNLRCNRIASVGGQALASLLVRGSPLEEVNLEANRIGDEGAKAWDVALRRSASLRVLDIRNNSIEDEGLVALVSAFDENSTLSVLKLWGNHFDRASLDAFARQYESRMVPMGLAVDAKPYEVDGKVQVAKVDPEEP